MSAVKALIGGLQWQWNIYLRNAACVAFDPLFITEDRAKQTLIKMWCSCHIFETKHPSNKESPPQPVVLRTIQKPGVKDTSLCFNHAVQPEIIQSVVLIQSSCVFSLQICLINSIFHCCCCCCYCCCCCCCCWCVCACMCMSNFRQFRAVVVQHAPQLNWSGTKITQKGSKRVRQSNIAILCTHHTFRNSAWIHRQCYSWVK